MNAYELANEIEKGGKDGFYQDEMVAILRQQADRIAELEKTIQNGIQSFGKVQDEMLNQKFTFPRWSKEKEMFDSWANHETPQTKPLTDEEITNIANANVDGNASLEQLKWFARSIEAKILGETK